jgi:ribosomal protein S18 acetylase RimI-like enzyme
MSITIIQADYANSYHAKAIPALLNAYALDPMGGGTALKHEVTQALVTELAKLPHAMTLLAFVDDEPAGLANCFEAFSTFACKPIINIHDIAVLPKFRGLGLSQHLLQKIEEIAIDKGCCKMTLEVLSNNHVAKSAYTKFGFQDYVLDPNAGTALFWQKSLS